MKIYGYQLQTLNYYNNEELNRISEYSVITKMKIRVQVIIYLR